MLWKLLVEYLRPQRRLLIAVVVFQLAQSIASLYLPTLNADIIDEGVAKGDTGVHPAAWAASCWSSRCCRSPAP